VIDDAYAADRLIAVQRPISPKADRPHAPSAHHQG
jgi:hypothetical protein